MYMYIILSHAVAFASLFVGSIFDIKTTEVPDSVSASGVVAGIVLHFLASLNSGLNFSQLLDVSLLISSPWGWAQALGDPLLWSLGMGIVFSIVGWGLYLIGMWGGADAFAMSVLGFGAPTAINTFSYVYSIDLFVNILLTGFLYTLGFAVYKSRGSGSLKKTLNLIRKKELRISSEIIVAAIISGVAGLTGRINPVVYFGIFLSLIFLFRYLKIIQRDVLSEKVPVSELEGGEVLARGETEDNKVKGITEEEIDQIEVEEVEVREGVRFVPVFPVALVMTDVLGVGVNFIFLLVSL